MVRHLRSWLWVMQVLLITKANDLLFVKKQGLFNLCTINLGEVQCSSWIIDCMEELPIDKHATFMSALLMCTNMFTYNCPLSQLHALVGIQWFKVK